MECSLEVKCLCWQVQELVFTPPADICPWHTESNAHCVSFKTETTIFFFSTYMGVKGDIMRSFFVVFVR